MFGVITNIFEFPELRIVNYGKETRKELGIGTTQGTTTIQVLAYCMILNFLGSQPR